MHNERIHEVLDDALDGRRLLTHPFYRRWEAGTLGEGELGAYAGQYRHIERALPGTLAAIAEALPEGPACALVEANLADELGAPAPHTALFESFARAAGTASEVDATPATDTLLRAIGAAAATDPVAALSMVAAYEVQAAEIAASKAEGLRRHYGMDAAGTQFWDVHATLEVAHGDWSTEALAALDADSDVVYASALLAADAWWEFLTERENAAPVASAA